jgi:hypothetical protein
MRKHRCRSVGHHELFVVIGGLCSWPSKHGLQVVRNIWPKAGTAADLRSIAWYIKHSGTLFVRSSYFPWNRCLPRLPSRCYASKHHMLGLDHRFELGACMLHITLPQLHDTSHPQFVLDLEIMGKHSTCACAPVYFAVSFRDFMRFEELLFLFLVYVYNDRLE